LLLRSDELLVISRAGDCRTSRNTPWLRPSPIPDRAMHLRRSKIIALHRRQSVPTEVLATTLGQVATYPE
jgi:hypothetical protein